MTIQDIIRRVRVVLNHDPNVVALTEFEDEDVALQIDDIIRGHIEPAARLTVLEAPAEYLTYSSQTTSTYVGGHREVTIDASAIRLGRAMVAGWSGPVYVERFVEPFSEEHLRQYGEFNGLKATSREPVVVVMTRNSGWELHLFGGITEDAQTTSVTYVTSPKITPASQSAVESISIDSRLEDALVNHVAALTSESLGDSNKYKELMGLAAGLANANNTSDE